MGMGLLYYGINLSVYRTLFLEKCVVFIWILDEFQLSYLPVARTMLMQERTSIVISQKCRTPTKSTEMRSKVLDSR